MSQNFTAKGEFPNQMSYQILMDPQFPIFYMYPIATALEAPHNPFPKGGGLEIMARRDIRIPSVVLSINYSLPESILYLDIYFDPRPYQAQIQILEVWNPQTSKFLLHANRRSIC
jgi:hypothetical protein